MTVWQENAAAFAMRSEQYITGERNQASKEIFKLLRAGRPGRAYYELCQSVNRQARVAGAAAAQIHACPCGGRHCDHGRCGR